jgi:hypothetical protein
MARVISDYREGTAEPDRVSAFSGRSEGRDFVDVPLCRFSEPIAPNHAPFLGRLCSRRHTSPIAVGPSTTRPA